MHLLCLQFDLLSSDQSLFVLPFFLRITEIIAFVVILLLCLHTQTFLSALLNVKRGGIIIEGMHTQLGRYNRLSGKDYMLLTRGTFQAVHPRCPAVLACQ